MQYTFISSVENDNFQLKKKKIAFIFFNQNIECVYSLQHLFIYIKIGRLYLRYAVVLYFNNMGNAMRSKSNKRSIQTKELILLKIIFEFILGFEISRFRFIIAV